MRQAQPCYEPGTSCLQLHLRVVLSMVIQMFGFCANDYEHWGFLYRRDWSPLRLNAHPAHNSCWTSCWSVAKEIRTGWNCLIIRTAVLRKDSNCGRLVGRKWRTQGEVYLAQAQILLGTSQNVSISDCRSPDTNLRAHTHTTYTHTHTMQSTLNLTSQFPVDSPLYLL